MTIEVVMEAILSHFDLTLSERISLVTESQLQDYLELIKTETDNLFAFCESHRLPHHNYCDLYDVPKNGTHKSYKKHLQRLQLMRVGAWQAAGKPFFEKPKFKNR